MPPGHIYGRQCTHIMHINRCYLKANLMHVTVTAKLPEHHSTVGDCTNHDIKKQKVTTQKMLWLSQVKMNICGWPLFQGITRLQKHNAYYTGLRLAHNIWHYSIQMHFDWLTDWLIITLQTVTKTHNKTIMADKVFSCSALTLLVEQQAGHTVACKKNIIH